MIMVSELMHEKFRKACEDDDITMSEYLRMCIKKKIKSNFERK